jgi:hypothetical protein
MEWAAAAIASSQDEMRRETTFQTLSQTISFLTRRLWFLTDIPVMSCRWEEEEGKNITA